MLEQIQDLLACFLVEHLLVKHPSHRRCALGRPAAVTARSYPVVPHLTRSDGHRPHTHTRSSWKGMGQEGGEGE